MLREAAADPEIEIVERNAGGDGGDAVDDRRGVEEEIVAVMPEGFSVHDANSANWVVTKVAESRARAARAAEWAARIARRSQYEEEHLLFRFEGQMRAWAKQQLLKLRGRRQSVPLPGGLIGFRAVAARVGVTDEKIVLEWARRACPTAIVTTERLLRTPVIEHVKKTGEFPEGVVLAPAREDFYIR